MNEESSEHHPRPRTHATLIVFAAAFAFAFSGFLMLGIWQLQRLSWKLDLIERVEARVHSPPTTAPADWAAITAARDEYRHVRLHGHFLPDKNTRVQSVTELGAGFWLLTPFQTDNGGIVLVNRGFVPPDWRDDGAVPSNDSVTGLLRLSERGGGFLRKNDPAANRWYSRDVAAIASKNQLKNVAPFFIDEELVDEEFIDEKFAVADSGDTHAALAPTFPRGGLTVVRFANNHLGYALTWFGMAALVVWAGWRLMREERKLHKPLRS